MQVRIAMVGKYTGLSDSYLSVLKVSALYSFLMLCIVSYASLLLRCIKDALDYVGLYEA